MFECRDAGPVVCRTRRSAKDPWQVWSVVDEPDGRGLLMSREGFAWRIRQTDDAYEETFDVIDDAGRAHRDVALRHVRGGGRKSA